MCKDAAAIVRIEQDVKHILISQNEIRQDIKQVNNHLKELNNKTADNTRRIDVQENRCLLVSKFEEKDFQRALELSEGNRRMLWDEIRSNKWNIATIAAAVTIIYQLGSVLGWW